MRKILLIYIILSSVIFAQNENGDDSIYFDAKSGRSYQLGKKSKFDPLTGDEIVKIDTLWIKEIPVVIEEQPIIKRESIIFDPETGIKVTGTKLEIIKLARAKAKENFNFEPWTFCGGPVTCGTMIGGGLLGGSLLGVPGFIIGSIGSLVATPLIMSKIETDIDHLIPDYLSIEEKEVYREIYLQEIIKQRQSSISNGVLFGCGATGIVFIILLMNAPLI